MRHPRAMGRRLSTKQAAIDAARRIKDATKPRRFVGTVSNVANRATNGTVEATAPVSQYAVTVQVRANVDLAADDLIWIREDQGAQGTYVFDGFVKGGGTGNNAADAPIPWTQSPGLTSPAGSGLTVTAPAGQTTTIGSPGDPIAIDGDIQLDLNDLQDVNAAAPSDADVLTWVDGSSEWQAVAPSAGGWPFSGKYLEVDTSDADAAYSTIAAAIAAAGAGDTILLSSESHACANQTLPDGVHLGCIGPSAAILTNSTAAVTLNVGDGSVVFNIEVRNTYAAAPVYGVYMPTNTDTARFYDVTSAPDNSGGTGNAYAFYVGGSSELVNCQGISNAASYGYGVLGVGSGDKRIQGGYFDGSGVSGGDDVNNQAGTTTLIDPVLANDKVDTLLAASGTRGVWYNNAGQHRDDTQRVTNSSGSAVAANALGYLDENGEFQFSTTSFDSQPAPCVVLVGGANGAGIRVATRGSHITIELTANCSAGDRLYFSTSGGRAQPQTYMRPELVAIALTANGAGAGGTCEAILYCNTIPIRVSPSDNLYAIDSANPVSDSDWNGTIDSLPGGAAVRYDTVSGDEKALIPGTTTGLSKLRLYNSTRGTYALIDDSDPTGGAGYDGEITLTDNVPAGWVATDSITIRSQTNTSTVGPAYFLDLEITSSEIPALTRALTLASLYRDTGASQQRLLLHPWEANSFGKRVPSYTPAANVRIAGGGNVNIIQNRLVILWEASGSGTIDTLDIRAEVAMVAAP